MPILRFAQMVIMATTDATRCYAVGDDLTTPANQARPAAVEVLQSDLSRILSHHRHRNTGNRRNRKVIRRQLNGVPSDVATSRRIGTLRQAFADDLPTIVENEVTELRRLNLGGRDLVLRLELLQERYRLNPADQSSESATRHQATRIICSEGLL